MQNQFASKRALMLCRLFRPQPAISSNAVWGCFAGSQSRFVRTKRLTGHFLSSARIGKFSKQQDHSKHYSSSFLTDSLPPVSTNQKLAIDKLIFGSGNVTINACAGSGKTTTILQIAAAGNKTILVFMYNRRIMEETISRVRSLRIEKTMVYTYHSFGCEFYSSECFTSEGLKRVLADDMQPKKELPQFDILALDELQDMNPIFYRFVRKVTKDSRKDGSWPQFLTVGDPQQEIYTSNGSDKRFLTLAEDLFQSPCDGEVKANGADWTHIQQMVSYRMPKQNANFVNEQVLKPPKGGEILTVKNDETLRPRYVTCDSLSDGPLCEILRLIDLGLSPSQIIVLAPSLRSKKYMSLRNLANRLVLRDPPIPVHISADDDVEKSELVTQGKIIFATYHQAKGIEREAAIVFGFDASYHAFRQENQAKLQSADNPQYVAVTRARTHLVLIHDYRYKHLSFIVQKTLHKSCEMVRLRKIEPEKIKASKRGWDVTGLTRHAPEQAISDCFGMLELRQVDEPRRCRDQPVTEIEVREGIWECVADITGTSIPAIYESRAISESKTEATCSCFSRVFRELGKKSLPDVLKLLPPEYIQRLRSLKQKDRTGTLDIADILYLTNVDMAIRSGYLVKVLSIPLEKYTWFTEAHAKTVFYTLKRYIPKSVSYEKSLGHMFHNVPVEGGSVCVFGCMDISTKYQIREVKWTGTTRPENILQLALYGAMSRAKLPDALNETIKSWTPYLLINVPLNQIIEVKPKVLEGGKDAFVEVLRRLVVAKTEQMTIRLGDMEFLEEAAGGFKNFIGKVTIPAWFSHVDKKHAS